MATHVGEQRVTGDVEGPVSRPVCLITGATDGVGKATAAELARRGFMVVIAARNPARAAAVSQELGVDFLIGDLASLEGTRALAQSFTERYARLDVLINNAGVFMPERRVTRDGFETTYQVNYLSQFLLTQLLLERLKSSAQGRVINLCSSVYAFGRFESDNLQSQKKFSVFGTYAASKLLVLMFTEALALRLAGTRVTANAVHPGIVRTPMMLKAPGAFRVVSYLSLPFSISVQQGARTSVFLATSPDVNNVSGRYFAKAKQALTKNAFDTPENRELLWNLSERELR